MTIADPMKGWSKQCIGGYVDACLGCPNPAHGTKQADPAPPDLGQGTADRVAVLQALAREDGGIEHSGGRCLSVLTVLTGHVYRSSQLSDIVRACEANGWLSRTVKGTKTFRIDLTDKGLDYLDGKPTGVLPPATPRPRLVPPPAPPKEKHVSEPDIKIAGGKFAPTIDPVIGEEPPAKPAKPKPLSLREALGVAGVLVELADNLDTWARVASFPTVGGATSAAKHLRAEPELVRFEWSPVRMPDKTSVLYGRCTSGS